MQLDDLNIIKQVKNGNTELFSCIVEKYHRHILNFIYTIVYDTALVEDIGQNVFVKAYTSLDTFDGEKGVPFSAWLFAIARNCCFSELRKKKIRRHQPIETLTDMADDNARSDTEIMIHERQKILADCLALLPEPYRSTMFDAMNDATIFEMAKKRGVPEGTIKSRFFRARLMLKTIIRQTLGDNPHETI